MASDSGKKAVLHKKHVARLQREQKQSRAILFTFIGILVAVVLLLIYGYMDINVFQLKRPVAKVGNAEILVNQLQARVRLQRQQILAQYNTYQQYAQFGMDVQSQLTQLETQLNAPTEIGQAVLDQLINEQLVRLEAEKRGITFSDAELEEVKGISFAYFPNGSPTPSITPTQVITPKVPAEAFKIITITPIPSATPVVTTTPDLTSTAAPTATEIATLAPTAVATNGPTETPQPTATAYSLEGFQTKYKETQSRMALIGLSEKDFLAFFEIQLLEKKLNAELTANVPHTEKQVWARHILVADQVTADSVLERLNNREDFAVLAKELSTDTGSGANGGDLGWFGSGQMVAEFETAAFALENPGDITKTAVQSQFGFHIIQLIAKQDRPLSADQYDAAKNKVYTEWLAAARETYGVEIFDIWQQYVPIEPNFASIATDFAKTATKEAKDGTATPKP